MRPWRTRKRLAIAASTAVALASLAGGTFAAAGAAGTTGKTAPTLGGVARLVHGYEGYCALLKSRRVECWGDNAYGELGAGSTAPSSNLPLPVKGLSAATSLVAGYEGYCALLKSGHVECWGDNAYGELGAGSTAGSSDVAVAAR